MSDIIRVSRPRPTPVRVPFPRGRGERAYIRGGRVGSKSLCRIPLQPRFVVRIKRCHAEIQTFGVRDGDRWPKLARLTRLDQRFPRPFRQVTEIRRGGTCLWRLKPPRMGADFGRATLDTVCI